MNLFLLLIRSSLLLFFLIVSSSRGEHQHGQIALERGFLARLNPGQALSQELLQDMYAEHVASVQYNARIQPDPAIDNIKNCCLTKCPSEVLVKPKPVDCPERYLMVSPWAQFNNLLVIYVHALLLASKLNRTLLIVDGDLYDFDWPAMFRHHPGLCVRFAGESEFRDLVRRNGRTVRSLVWEDRFCESRQVRGIQMERILLDAGHLKRYSTEPYLGCVADSLPRYVEDLVQFTPCPFFLGVDKESYMDALRYVRISDEVASVGDQIIRDRFAGGPFVGVHLRQFEGSCRKSMEITFVGHKLARYLDDALLNCEMPWSYIETVLSSVGLDANTTPIYLATDNQAPDIVRRLLNHPNVVTVNKTLLKPYRKLNPLLLDMYMLTKSAHLIGNPYSSLTFHVALWREIDGFAAESNHIPAYQETGYLMHLFLDP